MNIRKKKLDQRMVDKKVVILIASVDANELNSRFNRLNSNSLGRDRLFRSFGLRTFCTTVQNRRYLGVRSICRLIVCVLHGTCNEPCLFSPAKIQSLGQCLQLVRQME